MAYISKKGKKWGYTVSLGIDPVTKKQIQKTKTTFNTKREAALAAQELEYRHKIEQGIIISKRNRFSEVCEDWLSVYSLSVKPSTLRIRKKALKMILPLWGTKKIDTITPRMYQSLITTLSKKYTRNYVESIHSTLSLVFRFAKNDKLIFEIPCENVVFPKSYDISEVGNYLEKDELQSFLKVAKESNHYNNYAIFYTLSLTGLRIGELMALQWQDIDLENKLIHVTKTLYNPSNNGDKYKLLPPKTKHSMRTVPIADDLLTVLTDYKDFVEMNIQKQSSKSFVFFKNDGKPLTNTFVRNRLKALLKKWDIPKDITIHSFRHTFASLLIEQNESVINVSELLGHSDTTITTKIYTHLTKNRKTAMQKKLSEFAINISLD